MVRAGSYDVSSFSANLQHEIRRLDAQVDLFWKSERALLLRHGLRDDMDVLDCGCGPGRLLELIKSEFPAVKCTGLEVDPILVDAANKKVTARGLRDWRVVQGSAEDSGLPEASFDFITMRLVLEHVPDPVLALRQLAKLLRPGGRLFVISNDFEFHLRTWPAVPQLDALYEAYCASRREDGGDPCIGRRLPLLFQQAGLGVLGFELEVSHNVLTGDAAFLQAEGVGIPAQLVSGGFLEQRVFEDLIQSWKQMLAHPDHCIMRPLFVAVGERPNGTNNRLERAEFAVASNGNTARPPASARLDVDAEFVAPGTELQRLIATIWREAIGLDRVGITHNFFDLGGDSLMLEHVQSALRERAGIALPMATLFQFPTVAALAAHLEQAPRSACPAATEAAGSEPIETERATSIDDDVRHQAQRRREALGRRRRPDAENDTFTS